MHGMLSLVVLVAAFVGLAGWAGYLSVRLYRACPAGQTRPPSDTATGRTDGANATRPGPSTEASLTPADTPDVPGQHAPGSHPVA